MVSLRIKIILLIVSLISLFALSMHLGIQSIILNNSRLSLKNQIYTASRIVNRVIQDLARYKTQTIRALAGQNDLREAIQKGDFLSLPIVLIRLHSEKNFNSLQIRKNDTLVSRSGDKLKLPSNWKPLPNAFSELYLIGNSFYFVSSAPIYRSYYLVGISKIDKDTIKDIQKTTGIFLALYSSANLSVSAPDLSHIEKFLSHPDKDCIKATFNGVETVTHDGEMALTHLYSPFKNLNGKIIGSQIITLFSPKAAQLRYQSGKLSLQLLVITTFIALFTGILFSSSILRPIRKLIRWAQQVRGKHIEYPPTIISHDEIQELSETFAMMTTKIRDYNHHLEDLVNERTEELKQTNKKLRKLDEMKNDFITNITHDFRSPLTVILNHADLIIKLHPDLDQNIKQPIKTIGESALKLKNSIDRLLDLAKMDTKGVKLHISQLNLAAFLSDLTDFYASTTVESNIKIKLYLPPFDIPDIFTDPEKLEQVLDNVISNAIKFVDPTNGKIDIFLREDEKNAIIEIKDNGVGIKPEKLESVFDRFEQVDGGKNSLYKGSGIGLAFSKQLMSFLKGEIFAKSEGEGKGCSFYIVIPKGKEHFKAEDMADGLYFSTNRIAQKKLMESDIRENQQSREIFVHIKERNKENEYNPQKALILVVDDNYQLRKIIAKYLELHGFHNYLLASDGKMALEAIYKFLPDLIISDFNMPNMRGDELHDLISKNPNTQNIPFIFLSAVTGKNIVYERRKRGAAAYLKKPIDENEFIITVTQQLKIYMSFLEMNKLAIIDELTGLLNKRELLARFNRELQIRKYRNISVIFFDIDHFKRFNDTYGHQLGDKVLQEMGQVITDSVRSYDIAGRYGGEEFMVILPDTSLKDALTVAEKLRSAIEVHPVFHNNMPLNVTASFGVSSLKDYAESIEQELNLFALESLFVILDNDPEQTHNLSQKKQALQTLLIKMADQALYEAKATHCISCGYQSADFALFRDGFCPKCKNRQLIKGRNKVLAFREE